MDRYRYCYSCKQGTLQYSEKRYCENKVGWFERIFLTIASGGVYEVCLDDVWTCTECGKEG